MQTRSPDIILNRRRKRRFAVDLPVRYRGLNEDHFHAVGNTVNVSSNGLLIAGPCALDSGECLEVIMEWPFALKGNIPLQLVMRGVVVRKEGSSFAIAFNQYHLRLKRRTTPADSSR